MDTLTILFIVGWAGTILFGLVLFFIFAVMGKNLIEILKAKIKNQKLIYMNGKFISAKEISGTLVFKENKVKKSYVVESGDYHRFCGIDTIILDELEGVAVSDEAKMAMLDFSNAFGEDALQKYITLVMKELVLEKLAKLNNLSEEGYRALAEIRKDIENIEKIAENAVIIKDNIKEGIKEIQLRNINTKELKQYYRDMPPERFANIAETLGYWLNEMKKTDWMNIVMPFAMLVIIGALGYIMITNGGGDHSTVATAAKTAINSTVR